MYRRINGKEGGSADSFSEGEYSAVAPAKAGGGVLSAGGGNRPRDGRWGHPPGVEVRVEEMQCHRLDPVVWIARTDAPWAHKPDARKPVPLLFF